ncbi:MAG: coat protein 1 [Allium deltapartitivirus]|nr:MAG: coat protein 1 [Allium deltapartitivirus]
MESSRAAPSESKGSSPDAKTTVKSPTDVSDRPSVGTTFRMRAEIPTEPEARETAIYPDATDLPAAGNPDYTIELKDEGRLGDFYPRDKVTAKATAFYINVRNFYSGIRETIYGALQRLFRVKTTLGDADFLTRIDSISDSLAAGCCLTAYLKVRDILFLVRSGEPSPFSLRRPRADTDLAIPSAFAFAIQQLGIVHVADLDSDLHVFPCFPQTGHRFGIPTDVIWNPNEYAQAVEYARNLGMRFSVVDLSVKYGSAWWLLRQYYEDDLFELRCTYPETNFTDQMAITHSLFLNGSSVNPTNAIITFADQTTTGNYGSMLRDPHPGINVSSFEAIAETASEVWSHV